MKPMSTRCSTGRRLRIGRDDVERGHDHEEDGRLGEHATDDARASRDAVPVSLATIRCPIERATSISATIAAATSAPIHAFDDWR